MAGGERAHEAERAAGRRGRRRRQAVEPGLADARLGEQFAGEGGGAQEAVEVGVGALGGGDDHACSGLGGDREQIARARTGGEDGVDGDGRGDLRHAAVSASWLPQSSQIATPGAAPRIAEAAQTRSFAR